MALFYFTVNAEENATYVGEVEEVAEGYNQYIDRSFGESDIFYKTENARITDIICDTTLGQDYARQEVQDFLEALDLD